MINLLVEQHKRQSLNCKITNQKKQQLLQTAEIIKNTDYKKHYNGFTINEIQFNIENIDTDNEKILIKIPENYLQKNNNIFLLEVSLRNHGDFNYFYIYNDLNNNNYFLNSIDDKYTIVKNNEGMQ